MEKTGFSEKDRELAYFRFALIAPGDFQRCINSGILSARHREPHHQARRNRFSFQACDLGEMDLAIPDWWYGRPCSKGAFRQR